MAPFSDGSMPPTAIAALVIPLKRAQEDAEKFMWRILALAIPSVVLLALPAAAGKFDADYPPCGDKPSTLEIVECIGAKTKIWNDRLNKAYKKLPQRIEPRQRGPLKDAQRLWLKYRDANCTFYDLQEGTIRLIQAAECVRSMTKDRAIELENAMKFE